MARGALERVPRRVRMVVAAAVILGVGLRAALVYAAPRWGYVWDHFDVIGMGLVAEQRGLTRAYSATPEELPTLRGNVVRDGRTTTIERRNVYLPNYPPLCALVFWLQSRWLGAGRPDFVANTVATRLVTSIVPWCFELLTAIGVALATRVLTGRPVTALYAGVAMWLAPPLMLDTGLFGQYDALALAPATFALAALLAGWWGAAGVAVGLGLLLKPQGLLMLPIAAFAAAVGAAGDDRRTARDAVRRIVRLGGAALVTVLVGSAPWMLADGLAWVRRCYRMNLFEVLPYTTLEAFNVWYLAALVNDRAPVFDVLSSTAAAAGLTRDAWGRLALALALAATAALVWWRLRARSALAVVVFAGLALWSVFVWPTRVHERYILFCVPAMIVAAAAVPRLRLAVAVLLVVATMELSWMVWRTGPPVGSFDRRAAERVHDQRFRAYWQGKTVSVEAAQAGPKREESIAIAFEQHRAGRRRSERIEWLLTLLSLGAYAAAVGVVAGGGALGDPVPPRSRERGGALST